VAGQGRPDPLVSIDRDGLAERQGDLAPLLGNVALFLALEQRDRLLYRGVARTRSDPRAALASVE
jgi:hypothetical protein